MKDYLIKMIDGGIKDFNYESDDWGGCPTCNYGSRYIDEFYIEMSDHKIHIKVTKEYEHAISEAFLMKYFIAHVEELKTLTEEQFFEFLKNNFSNAVEKHADVSKFEHYVCEIKKIGKVFK